MSGKKAYIGDGAFVEFDGFAVVLSTEDGEQTTNRIVLEPDTLNSLLEWLQTMAEELTRDELGT
jgi:hypothetical protein